MLDTSAFGPCRHHHRAAGPFRLRQDHADARDRRRAEDFPRLDHGVRPAAGARSLRRRIGYVAQSPSIYPDLSTVENVRYFASMYGVVPHRVRQVINAVGLSDKKFELAGNLSGGQMGRVSLACAMVCDPDLLILDEPTVGLDPLLRAELWEQFSEYAARGKTLLVSSHAMDEARNCDELILMRDGTILAHASPQDIMRRTACADLESAFMSLVRAEPVPPLPEAVP